MHNLRRGNKEIFPVFLYGHLKPDMKSGLPEEFKTWREVTAGRIEICRNSPPTNSCEWSISLSLLCSPSIGLATSSCLLRLLRASLMLFVVYETQTTLFHDCFFDSSFRNSRLTLKMPWTTLQQSQRVACVLMSTESKWREAKENSSVFFKILFENFCLCLYLSSW